MLIIAGHVTVDPERREEYVLAHADLVRRCRDAPGCLDTAVTADQVDPARVNIYERWDGDRNLQAWRARADAPETGIEMLAVEVRLFDASGERSPF